MLASCLAKLELVYHAHISTSILRYLSCPDLPSSALRLAIDSKPLSLLRMSSVLFLTSAMLSIVGERERTHLGSIYAHARFLSGCSGMVECLASYYCVSLVPRPIERV